MQNETATVEIKSGLHAITHDRSRDWKHKRRFGTLLFGSTAPAALPLTLGRQRLPVEDQGETSLCTEMGTSKANGYRVGIDMSPDWQGAMEGRYAGDPIVDGTDPKTAMNSCALVGSLPKPFAPFTLAKDGETKVTDWRQWPSNLFSLALQYAPSGWYEVSDGDGDVFDDIRVALCDAQSDNGVVQSFGFWYQEWSDTGNAHRAIVSVPTRPPIARHNYLFIDFIERGGIEYLVAQLSSGTQFGEDGFLLFPREVVNYAFANMMVDGTGLYIFRSTGSRFQTLINMLPDFIRRLTSLVVQLEGQPV